MDTKRLKPKERLEILRKEDAERLKARVVARIEALLAEKYVDQEGVVRILDFLE